MGLVTDYIIALTHLYGLVHKGKVVEIYNKQNDEVISEAEIGDKAKNSEEEMNKYFVQIYGDYFVHETIMEFENIDDELAKKSGKPYYIPAQDELLRYKDDNYFERNKAYEMLKTHVQENFCNGDLYKAEAVCEDIQGECQYGSSLTGAFEVFERRNIEFENRKQVEQVMDLIVDLSNNTRLWENNGLTPNELHRQTDKKELSPLAEDGMSYGSSIQDSKPDESNGKSDPIRVRKIGRNDPCPCGSGKNIRNAACPGSYFGVNALASNKCSNFIVCSLFNGGF